MLMDLFAESVPDTVRLRRIHFHAFMREIHETLHNSPDLDIKGVARKFGSATRVLCFDEFHVGDVADAMILQRLFSALISQGVILVATTNYPPDRLYEGGLQRKRFLPFIDFLKNRLKVIELAGKTDYREQDNTCPDNTYLFPVSPANERQASRIFREMSHGAPKHTHHLHIKRRTLNIQAAGGVAWCDFGDLCEQPLGAGDFAAIAEKFHTVFLINVPVLQSTRRNEAKRFMTLIDVLYDHNIRLVITAQTDPDHIYTGQDHAFEFQRTISRLKEMTSQDYFKTAHKRTIHP